MSQAADYPLSRWIFVRLVGATFLIAFVSWWTQIDDLVGSTGLLPIAEYLDAVETYVGHIPFARVPTVFWLSSGDGFIHFIAFSGIVLSLLLIVGVWPRMLLALLWFSYLSFVTTSRDFLSFQWDSLLLETALVAIPLAPASRLPEWPMRLRASAPTRISVWLVRILLFKLMFCSGIGKLLSGDETWRNLTALSFHYETQPLPTWVAWYVHQLPPWFHKVSAILMFVVELAVPFLMFLGRRARLVCAIATSSLMVVIGLTGNYTFFNGLAIVLCLTLVDDATLRRVLRLGRGGEVPARISEAVVTVRSSIQRWRMYVNRGALGGFVLLYIIVSAALVFSMMMKDARWPAPIDALVNATYPFRSINRYGLFTVMTTTRPEIVIEGSGDGQQWRAYEFNWKPGDLSRRPAFVAPHQPRLDWQMWFAALGNYKANPWLARLMERLLAGDPITTSMFRDNPFADTPPAYVRAVLYDYRFSDPRTRRETGHWWVRESPRLYAPVITSAQP